MYLVFIFHVSSSSGGRAPWDSVSSGPLMLDLLKALLSLVREKKKNSAQQQSHWMKPRDLGSLFGLTTDSPMSLDKQFNPFLSQFTICRMAAPGFPSLMSHSLVLRTQVLS